MQTCFLFLPSLPDSSATSLVSFTAICWSVVRFKWLQLSSSPARVRNWPVVGSGAWLRKGRHRESFSGERGNKQKVSLHFSENFLSPSLEATGLGQVSSEGFKSFLGSLGRIPIAFVWDVCSEIKESQTSLANQKV